MMKLSIYAVLLAGLFLAGCTSDPYRGLYEGIKSQNEGYKTPTERAATPSSPSYDTYQKERESLKQ